jgi:hypothetical protein
VFRLLADKTVNLNRTCQTDFEQINFSSKAVYNETHLHITASPGANKSASGANLINDSLKPKIQKQNHKGKCI